jgi:leucyl/phenylalanyl-tRNA--protein transferase
MQLHILDDTLWFPPVTEALDDGLLAVGGDLSVERLLLAYNSGIFPWYAEDEPPMWWSPDPRFVLFPDELKVSKSMKQVLKRNTFQFKMNTVFEQVINNCRMVFREGQGGTWIGDDVVAAYTQLHKLGYAHSAEAWQDGELVGGLYGIWLGNAFFGESMFAHRSNASKFAFINMVELLQSRGVQLIDCQVYTEHLESLGAVMIDRNTFIKLINELNPVL